MKKILEFKDVKKSFGKKEVLKDINLSINKGDRLAIIGSNGSGKSTMINIMVGLLEPTEGKVSYLGFDNDQIKFKESIGIQFQDGTYPRGYTINEIINMVHDLNFKGTNMEYKEFIKNVREPIKEELLEVFELKEYQFYKTQKLSGGQKQKLNVILALVKKPEIVILDELTTGLDIEAQHKVVKYINNYVTESKATLIIISHIVFEMESLINRIVLLDSGEIIDDIELKDIVKVYKTMKDYVERYFINGLKPKEIPVKKTPSKEKIKKEGNK